MRIKKNKSRSYIEEWDSALRRLMRVAYNIFIKYGFLYDFYAEVLSDKQKNNDSEEVLRGSFRMHLTAIEKKYVLTKFLCIKFINSSIYIHECMNKHLLPFTHEYDQDLDYVFWPDLASILYSILSTTWMNENEYIKLLIQVWNIFILFLNDISSVKSPSKTLSLSLVEMVWSELLKSHKPQYLKIINCANLDGSKFRDPKPHRQNYKELH
ncbi:hypothetical protein BpHYR1_004660 [Brachionus plicatilis]|uniref:Uncharacterized protein n=1 Tax=Brachionus plicatilis TaxID=10195 RepID=A0A3M7SIP7_BRAPC|nr:hypothetical protein BpHYR1_004660 [Brachionus plicatilis]